jgi:hypothetical protein
MANVRTWWKLVIADDSAELSDGDREHIGELIKEGYIEGEVVKDED